jgi:hypothetical protein
VIVKEQMHMKQVIAVASVLAFLVPAVHAQEGRRGGAPFQRVNVASDTVKGAPYSADVINESLQVLQDGNRIMQKTTSRVYRDSEGRTRREVDRPVVPEISINDPVAERSYTLNPNARTARENSFMPRVFGGTVNRSGELDALTVLLNGQVTSFVARGGNGGFILGAPNEQTTEEKLAPRIIEGLRVEGLRRTMTIPVGAIGNERPIVVTSEEWTSPELNAVVLSESSDPRSGTSTYKLVNVKRGDPPASLFQVPADYTVTQAPGRGVGVGVGEGRGGRSGAPR